MKKIIIIPVVMLFTLLQAKAQEQNPAIASTAISTHSGKAAIKDNPSFNLFHNSGSHGSVKDYDYYLKKKKDNLTAGLVTLGAGLVISGIGLITATNSTSFDTDATSAVLFVAGAASGIVSIPLMIMSTVYGHKAKLELSKQKTGFGVPANVSKDIMGITITFPIGK